MKTFFSNGSFVFKKHFVHYANLVLLKIRLSLIYYVDFNVLYND